MNMPMENTPIGRQKRPRILVVDDVEANRQLMCRRLEPFGYDLQQAESGPQALDSIRSRKPDLVLLDYMMPQMNGIEVLRLIRQDRHTAGLPIIILTARTESAVAVEALDAGADDYVSKPVDFEVLRARIETQLAKLRSSESLRQVNAVLDERATMRVMAFEELKSELEREMILRRESERTLAEAQSMIARCHACGRLNACNVPLGAIEPPPAPEAAIERGGPPREMIDIVDALARAATAGKPANPALLAALRRQIEDTVGGAG